MKIVFLGTPDFAVASLEATAKRHEILLVITQPDRPKGRRGIAVPPPVKVAAQALKIPVLQPESVNAEDVVATLNRLQPDVIAVAAFGQILRKQMIDAPRIACINVHASLLPRYRGAAPVPAAILNGETETGVTIQKVVRKLDAGDIIRQGKVTIGPEDTAGEVLDHLADLGAELLIEVLRDIEAGTAVFTPQNDADATYAPMLTKCDGRIDWSKSALKIDRQVRAMAPWPGAFTFLSRGEQQPLRVILKRVRAEDGCPAGEPGEVVEANHDGIAVRAGEGCVRIIQLQPAGKGGMTAAIFLRGNKVTAGDRFED